MTGNFTNIKAISLKYLNVTTDSYIMAGGLPWTPINDVSFLMPYDVSKFNSKVTIHILLRIIQP